MRGIIYKDVCLFFRSVEKRMLLLVGAVLVLLAVKSGVYAGMLASILLGMTVGIQNTLVFANEEKVEWEKYQRTLPVGVGKVVLGKYAAVLVTLLVSLTGAVAFNLGTFAIYRTFLLPVLGLSVLAAAVIPVAWAAVCLPFCYWFGYQTAQYASIVLIFPLFFVIKNFEDGMWTVADLASISRNPQMYLLVALLALAGMFLLSLAVSAAGYGWRGRRRYAGNRV